MASGDVDGALLIWKISAREDVLSSPEKEKVNFYFVNLFSFSYFNLMKIFKDKALDEFPPNKENWIRAFRVPIKHYGDVTCVAWSPDSTMVASVATDDTISVHKADTGNIYF